MESFFKIEEQVQCSIQNAECCLGEMGYKYVNNKNRGQVSDEEYWKILQTNAYIKSLKRYLDETNLRCKPPVLVNPSKPPCLNPQINSVPLGIGEADCFHCLTEREVLKMIEVLNIFCSTCNCN